MAFFRAQKRGEDAAIGAGAGLWLRRENYRSRPVADQHAGATVVPVEDAGERLSADHQRALVGTRFEEIIRRRQREDKAAAHRLEVERHALMDAEPVLDLQGGRGKGVVR